jgi:Tol biopolymer transport system component
VEALPTTTRISGVAHSDDGKLLSYISTASGRPNLWVMNADGSGARQMIQSNDRQANALFTHDGSALVYSQDRGGNESYDIFVVPVEGGDARN